MRNFTNFEKKSLEYFKLTSWKVICFSSIAIISSKFTKLMRNLTRAANFIIYFYNNLYQYRASKIVKENKIYKNAFTL